MGLLHLLHAHLHFVYRLGEQCLLHSLLAGKSHNTWAPGNVA